MRGSIAAALKRQQSAGGNARRTDSLRIDHWVRKHLVQQDALMRKQQAVPAVSLQSQGLVEVMMGIATGLHADVLHRVHDIARFRKVRGTRMLIAVFVVQNLCHLAVSHEADDGWTRLGCTGRLRFEPKETKQPLTVERDVKLATSVRFVLRLRTVRDGDFSVVRIEHAIDESFSLARLPLTKRFDRLEFRNRQRTEFRRRCCVREAAYRRRHLGSQAGLESFDSARRFQIHNAETQPPQRKSANSCPGLNSRNQIDARWGLPSFSGLLEPR